MITVDDFFREDTLNIFADASMNSYGTCGCIGVCPVYGSIDKRFPLLKTDFYSRVFNKCTNNFAEGRAIMQAIYIALHNKDKYPIIRILSDSQITLFGIRDRITQWKISKKPDKDGFVNFVGSSGYIKNQDIFLEAFYLIMDNDLSIEFLWQAGHVSFSDPDKLVKSGDAFKRYNNIQDELDIELLRSLAFFNNYVDRNSRDVLYSVDMAQQNSVIPFSYKVFDGYDKEVYKRLTHPDSIFNKET